MSFRTIMIFPVFENMELINSLRKQYDPLAELVNPHITLVFPFESQMSNEELFNILNIRLNDIKPFELTLSGVSKQENIFGKYLFLNVIQGKEELENIHKALYKNEFAQFDTGLQYEPHMTIGKFSATELLEKAYSEINPLEDMFYTIVDKVSVEIIGENGKSVIVIEREL